MRRKERLRLENNFIGWEGFLDWGLLALIAGIFAVTSIGSCINESKKESNYNSPGLVRNYESLGNSGNYSPR
jgi:hypothetical protein